MKKLAKLLAIALVLGFGLATTATYTATPVQAAEEQKGKKEEKKGDKGGKMTEEHAGH